MTALTSREVRMHRRPQGLPTAADFSLAEVTLAPLEDGQVQVRNRFMSVDPYMRGRMNDGASYVPPFTLDQVLEGSAVGEVMESRDAAFHQGDIVTSRFGWRERFIASALDLQAVSHEPTPLSAHLGVLGMTGMTAWAGLRLVDVKRPDVIYISAAAGAVGNVAGQLAHLRGCRVLGSAGSAAKVAFLLDRCGFDAAFDHHDGSVQEQLARLAPDGIDVYFDNVGGGTLQAALSAMRTHGRIIMCGGISRYNDATLVPGPDNLSNVITRRLLIHGLIVSDWLGQRSEFDREVGGAFRAGRLRNFETVVQGIDHAVDAFLGLFAGRNVGKMIVQLA